MGDQHKRQIACFNYHVKFQKQGQPNRDDAIQKESRNLNWIRID